jgi:hypothetical protein
MVLPWQADAETTSKAENKEKCKELWSGNNAVVSLTQGRSKNILYCLKILSNKSSLLD